MRAGFTSIPSLAILILGALLTLAPGARAAELKEGAPETYVVQPGDTLWSIAGRFLEDPWRWREVWHSNKDLPNPDLIYPGDVLRVSMVGGEPRIGVDPGGESEVGYRGGMRVVKLSPRVRTSSLKEAVPTIPIAALAPFLTQPFVAESDNIRRAPYVVGFPDEHIVAGIGDSVYVRRIDDKVNQRFQILRPGEVLRDPDTNEDLGHLAVFVANADLVRVGDPAKLQVVRAEREVAVGDRVIPAALEEPLRNFYPRPGPAGLRGRILAVLNGVSQIGQFDVVVLNKGSKDRLERGQVFEVYGGGTEERDQVRSGEVNFQWREESPLSTEFWYGSNAKIYRWRSDPFPPAVEIRYPRATFIKPFERSGLVMVFRTFDRVSFALVLEAVRPMHIEDRVAAPPS
ncbi:MAG: peptidoglycan-binding protein [Chromatiaceae bacterium]|nr:peptidoglycan-binding protein [Chromatiaceae bacterium]